MRKVLIVEDENLIRWALAQALTRAGYEVVLVETGDCAVEMIHAGSFDIVITDVKLPHISGIDVATALRLVSPVTPIILVSAEADEDARNQFAKLSLAYFVEKPFDLDDVVNLVSSLCKTSEQMPPGMGNLAFQG